MLLTEHFYDFRIYIFSGWILSRKPKIHAENHKINHFSVLKAFEAVTPFQVLNNMFPELKSTRNFSYDQNKSFSVLLTEHFYDFRIYVFSGWILSRNRKFHAENQ